MTFEDGLAVATLWQEARGSDHEARLCVAKVIRNRMAKRYTSDGTIAGTVLVPWQFSGWMDDQITRESLQYVVQDVYKLLDIWEESKTAPDLTKGAVLYYSPGIPVPDWVASCNLTLEIPGFCFYVPKVPHA